MRRAWWAALCLGLWPLIPSAGGADEVRLLSLGLRGGVTGLAVFGGDEHESFQQYDVVATAGLPWRWPFESGWGVDTRLLASAGALLGGGETGFVGTLVPVVALTGRDDRFSVDVGAGGALLSRHKFGNQDFGGLFQVVLTLGLRAPLYRALGVGYRLQHLSDAKLYGDNGKGADLHMVEVIYSFR